MVPWHTVFHIGAPMKPLLLDKKSKNKSLPLPLCGKNGVNRKKLFLWFMRAEAFYKCIRGKSFIENQSSQHKLDFKHWQIQFKRLSAKYNKPSDGTPINFDIYNHFQT